MARRKLGKLKGLMYEMEITQADIASAIGRGTAYTSTRMNGHRSWTLSEMQILGELLKIPKESWFDYFMDSDTTPFCEVNTCSTY